MNSAIRLISDEINTYIPNSDNSNLIKRKNYILPSPKGKFFIVCFVSHLKDGCNIPKFVTESLKHDIGIVYVCDKLPNNPIINSNVHYIEVDDTWFIHTLFMNPLMFSASYATNSKKQLSKAFSVFTKYQIPTLTSSSQLQKFVNNCDKSQKNILIEVSGGIGDHLLCIPAIKTLAQKYYVYLLCESHRQECFNNLSYIKGFYNKRQDVDVSRFKKIIYLNFGQLLNDYRLDLNKQNRIFSVAELCGLQKEELVITRPEIILTKEERQNAEKKWSSYTNKVFLGYDSARTDSKLPMPMAQDIVNRLKRKGCTIFTSSVRRKKLENCMDLSRELSIRELFSLISIMDCVLTIDTSFLHIASAFEKKTFCLLNYFNPAWRTSTYSNCESYIPNVSCFPCCAYQFVSHEERKCHNKSCYEYHDIDLILSNIKNYLREKKLVNEKISVVDTEYIPDTKRDISSLDLPGIIINDREQEKTRIAAFWMGGVGDSVMLGYLCRAIKRKHPNSCIDAFVRDLNSTSLFVYDYPDIKGVVSNSSWRETVIKNKDNYDIAYEFNRLPHIWYKDKSKENELDEKKYFNWSLSSQNIIKNWSGSIYEYYAKQTNLNLENSDLYIPINDKNDILQNKVLNKYEISNNFITINSGCDKNAGILKLWDRNKWKELCTKLKQNNINIIQLGNNFDENLDGVKKIQCENLIDLLFILKCSKLHIGNEGGLIHLAHAVKTKSIVLFGPTDSILYGYKDNINIDNRKCDTCWWVNSKWSQKCIRGNKSCVNIDSINVYDVYMKVLKELNYA